jgi:hypothetical protein
MVQLALEIPADLDRRLRERCKRVGSKASAEVRLALRRPLNHLPPDEAPPFGDAPPLRRRRRK